MLELINKKKLEERKKINAGQGYGMGKEVSMKDYEGGDIGPLLLLESAGNLEYVPWLILNFSVF